MKQVTVMVKGDMTMKVSVYYENPHGLQIFYNLAMRGWRIDSSHL